MKKRIFLIIFIAILFLPLNIFALSSDYIDKVSEITGTKIDEDKINLYLFKGKGCIHCADEEEWLKKIKEDYKDYLNVHEFEVWYDDKNAIYLDQVKAEFKSTAAGVPFTVVGDSFYVGYSNTIGSKIENKIKEYAGLKSNPNEVKIPFLGNVNMKNVSIPLVAVILGFIDGFNPCAMWILLFLINMLFTLNDKKKRWMIGYIFLFASAFVYFLAMLGINLVLGVAAIGKIKIAIAIFILIAGILNLRKYLKTRKEEAGCHIVNIKKRKKLMARMTKVMNNKSFVLSLLGVVVLATSVNLIELACSLGFPMIFTEMLHINGITGMVKIIYLLIYMLFYMIDDLVIFTISMITLQATGITNKYNKLCTLVSSIIMIIMGLLLLFKPEWLMLNF